MEGEQKIVRQIGIVRNIWNGKCDTDKPIANIQFIERGQDVQLYDAAKVDGANRLQQMWNIELPSILPTIIILLILNVGHLLGASFEMIYLLQNDANIAASEVISTYVYKIGIKASNQISYSTAIGLFNNVVNFVILIVINAISNKVTQTSLF